MCTKGRMQKKLATIVMMTMLKGIQGIMFFFHFKWSDDDNFQPFSQFDLWEQQKHQHELTIQQNAEFVRFQDTSDIQVRAELEMMTMKKSMVWYDERPTFALDENCEKGKETTRYIIMSGGKKKKEYSSLSVLLLFHFFVQINVGDYMYTAKMLLLYATLGKGLYVHFTFIL